MLLAFGNPRGDSWRRSGRGVKNGKTSGTNKQTAEECLETAGKGGRVKVASARVKPATLGCKINLFFFKKETEKSQRFYTK